ncbi:hypothetical protein ES288_A11G315300v1 [Gossypium darwinii]|uniref:Uncharacterized protein n=1 Tax=Gossypium darwinii TaxID=34276 RepID=A0A5D2ESQ7_GOSDA|nr:hypothetical protein ES288_A11G315300v1 [Gossypium darwinii]
MKIYHFRGAMPCSFSSFATAINIPDYNSRPGHLAVIVNSRIKIYFNSRRDWSPPSFLCSFEIKYYMGYASC